MTASDFAAYIQTLEDPEEIARVRIAGLEENIQSLREGVNILETECDEAEEKGDDQNYNMLEEKWEEKADILEVMEGELNQLNSFMQEFEYKKRQQNGK